MEEMEGMVEGMNGATGVFLDVFLGSSWSPGQLVCHQQEEAEFYKPGQQQWLLFPEWKQDKMTISKKYAPLRA